MGRQMAFDFARGEFVRVLESFDDKMIGKVVELMARIVVTVHEERKKEEEYDGR